ncbi:hypothetical protein FGU65_12465 [Methanoculleus sp. FWC-SCC1]|uniref:Uncharacterized protein n=1 Tax=Methanoculleus frigidifontis TaxID=2584085 RepID=A0ABT8MCM9_9EURY|nr:hypothetical protein [Methanoculleus sp. FWC-SCC1]MDN7025686.1 hypothetical protein [Methanoculleus sp. FWC-SCC1]
MNAPKRTIVRDEVPGCPLPDTGAKAAPSEPTEETIEHDKKRRLEMDIKRIQETEELVEIPL